MLCPGLQANAKPHIVSVHKKYIKPVWKKLFIVVNIPLEIHLFTSKLFFEEDLGTHLVICEPVNKPFPHLTYLAWLFAPESYF